MNGTRRNDVEGETMIETEEKVNVDNRIEWGIFEWDFRLGKAGEGVAKKIS